MANIWSVYEPEYNHNKVWGSECWLVNNDEYCGKILTLRKHFKCSFHHHKKKHETFIIIEGRVLLEYDRDEQYLLQKGDAIEIPREVYHSFTGIDKINKILEVSTRHYEDDSYRITKSHKLTWKEKSLLKKLLKQAKMENIWLKS